MILHWLKGNKRELSRGELMARGFELDLPDLLEMLSASDANEEPLARTLTLIAFANARSDLKVHTSVNKAHATDLPTTHADFGRTVALLFDKYPPVAQRDLDTPTEVEVKFRRLYHFYKAAMLGTASERAHATNAQLRQLADIWRIYIASATYLPAVLESTGLWSSEELEWFRGCDDESSHIRNVLYTVVPSFLWQHGEMLDMAKQAFGVRRSMLRR
jgi:hypothetical protein